MKHATKEFLFGADVPWEQVGEGLSRQILTFDDKIMLVKVRFETGAVGKLHEHHNSQVTYVESGEFEMTIGSDVKTIKAGDSYYIPPHVMHGCVCKAPGVLLDMFSPLREDFLPAVSDANYAK